MRAFEEVLATGESRLVSYTVEDKGRLHWCTALLTPERDEGGVIQSILMSVREIIREEVMKGEKELSEERFRKFVEAVGAIPWVYDLESDTMTYIGPQVERILGFSVKECMEPGFTSRQLHPDDRDDVIEKFVRYSRSKSSFVSEYRFLTASGEIRWFRDIVTVEPGVDGKAPLTRGLMHDVTAEKKAVEALKESEARYERAIKGAAVGLWEVDLATGIVAPSTRLLEILGLEQLASDEPVAWWKARVHPIDLSLLDETFESNLIHGEACRADIRMLRGDNTWGWYHIRGELNRDEQGTPISISGTLDDITVRKRTEEMLNRRENVLQRMSSLARVGWWNLDLKTSRVEWSDESYRISEVPKDQPLDLDYCIKFYPPEAQQVLTDLVEKAVNEGMEWDVELPYITGGGNSKWVRILGVPIRFGDEVTRLEGIIQDVSERRNAINALEQREKILAALAFATERLLLHTEFEEAIGGVLEKLGEAMGADLVSICRDTMEGTTPMVSTVCHTWRKSGSINEVFMKPGDVFHLEEIGLAEQVGRLKIGQHWSSMVCGLSGMAREILENFGVVGILQVPIKVRDEIWGHLTIMDGGSGRQWPESVVDALWAVSSTLAAALTRAEAEKAMRESEENYRTIFSNIRDCMIIVDPETMHVVEANRAALETYGYTLREMQALEPLGWSADPEAALESLKQTPLEKTRYIPFRLHKRKDGTTFPVEIVQSIFHIRGRVLLGCVIRDISMRIRLEEERRQMESRLQQSAKMESLGVLAGGIAHDFNNLLVGIMGSASIAAEEVEPDSPAADAIELVEKTAKRAADLTRQMLAYSGRGRFVVEAVNLTSLVREMSHLLETSITSKGQLICEFMDNVPAIEGDLTQIRQIVMNLILNASDSLEGKDGVIRVQTGVMDADLTYLKESFIDGPFNAGRFVYMEVRDTGVGMSEETKRKIFDPFFTTKTTGRGLGLAAVLGIVRGHRGFIHVESEPGKGTTFRVGFPTTKKKIPGTRVTPTKNQMWKGSGTILIIDDERTIHQVLKVALTRAGFELLHAHDGVEGLDVYKKNRGGIDLVLLDMTMPRMNGDEVFREIRKLDGDDVPVLLMSGFSEVEATNKFHDMSLAGFIQKPFRPSELLEKIKAVINGDESEG